MRDTAPVRPDEQFDVAALDRYLRSRLPEATGPLVVEQFPGGHSNLTSLLRYGEREFVMRRPPVGPVAPTAHDMTRGHRALNALWREFPPAPRPYLLCEDPSVERRRGIVIRREWPKELGDDPATRRKASEAMVDVMAALHAVDYAAAGLGTLGKPDGFVQRQVKGWAERWERAKDREVQAITDLARWLAERIPKPTDATLVHGDLKLDNVMLDATDPGGVVAVLDWEMCTTGDPLVDLGQLLCYWAETGDPYPRRESVVQVTTLPGFYTREQIVARYAEKTGRDVSKIAFYEIFAIYKTAVVVQQIYIRWKRGQTKDERFAGMGPRVEALAQAALTLAAKSGL
ncbi:MAG: phosphotransferase family protein [Candidatus Rokubacteria bacterium]|nr:phosphotransferase family protein [Candidatus Rokubacteria bacterium]MBI2544427.1 phosphotransferase family protein [Candidatus Rokubacteria bacterium]